MPGPRPHGAITAHRTCSIALPGWTSHRPRRPSATWAEAALWFHDAVHEPLAADNEERSADWARRALARLDVAPHAVEEIARLILLTRHTAPPADPAGRLLCDIDLSILGRPPAEFADYERRIRAEYAAVPDAAYRKGRRRVLGAFLARDPLYGTPWFRERYEQPARANLQRAIERLGPPD
jgi:predicted metal-dependent HD superfamily phosphohydrolase